MQKQKTKTKLIRPLLLEAMQKKNETINSLSQKTKLHFSTIYNLLNCNRDGDFEVWLKIQKVLSLKDKDMWAIIHTTKRVLR